MAGEEETPGVRPDLAEVLERRARILDAARPEAVDKRHARGRRTARENLDDLIDPGSFVEYGGLAIAAQRGRRDVAELIGRTPARRADRGDGADQRRAVRRRGGGVCGPHL